MRTASTFFATILLIGACAAPYDGVGRTPPDIGAGLNASRVAGR